jgi:hypothetical protein
MGEGVGRTKGGKRGVVRMADNGLEVGRTSVPVPAAEGTAASEVGRASAPAPAADGALTTPGRRQ